jgi:hypothetical protein
MLRSFWWTVAATAVGILIERKSDSASLGVYTLKQHLEKKRGDIISGLGEGRSSMWGNFIWNAWMHRIGRGLKEIS